MQIGKAAVQLPTTKLKRFCWFISQEPCQVAISSVLFAEIINGCLFDKLYSYVVAAGPADVEYDGEILGADCLGRCQREIIKGIFLYGNMDVRARHRNLGLAAI